MTNSLEDRMRRGEWFHSLTVPDGMWTVLRMDGRNFHKVTADMKKPADRWFAQSMVGIAKRLVSEFQGVYAYAQSDEISVLLPRESDLFGRELEKLVSLSAAAATSLWCERRDTGWPAGTFDSRIWVGADIERTLDYFRWRQDDATSNALSGVAYWTLRQQAGMNPHAATRALEGLDTTEKNELLFSHGVNFDALPAWQRRGTGVRWQTYPHVGRNPLTDEPRTVTRRRIISVDVPVRQEYRTWLGAILRGEEPIDPIAETPEET